MKRDYVGALKTLAPLRRLVKDVEASAGLKCPNCDDVGWYSGSYLDGGGEEAEEQIQCEFCYTVADSIFNRKNNADS